MHYAGYVLSRSLHLSLFTLGPDMQRDFSISMGISLVQSPHELDLHNDYDFEELRYSVLERRLSLLWRRSKREGVATSLPGSATIQFCGVSELRFQPRDADLPFTEDDCLHSFGYWTDEDWAEGSVMLCDETQANEARWLTAIEFMSGAIVLVQADSAHATIVA